MIYNFYVFPQWAYQWKVILPMHVQKDLSQKAAKKNHDFLVNRGRNSSKRRPRMDPGGVQQHGFYTL
jgi:hypothetical protein